MARIYCIVILSGILCTSIELIGCQDSCDLRITQAPPSYIMNGTDNNVTLTCNVVGATEFTWAYNRSGQLSPMLCLDNVISRNTCTYQPTRETANLQVRCRAASSTFTDVYCTPNVQYPPQSDPVISATQGRPLQQGDVLTCSVSGGRPPNTTINFTCSDPNMTDQPDVTDDVTVSSNVTVIVSQVGQENMTCTCSATWNPRPDLYIRNATKTFPLSFADVMSFTINNSSSMVVPINQSVVLNCAARGRPAPNVTLYDARGNVIMTQNGQNTGNSLDIVETSYDFLLNVTEVNQTGQYRCEANNDVSMPAENKTFLGVPSKPEAKDDTFADPDNPPVLKDSLSFTLQAYPPPTITISHNGNDMNRRRRSTGDHFDASCLSVVGMEYLARCNITVIHIQVTGMFQGEADNTQGKFTFEFQIKENVTTTTSTTTTTTTPPATTPQALASSALGEGPIAGIIIGVIAFIAIVIVIVALVIRSRRKKHDVDKRDGRAGSGQRESYTPHGSNFPAPGTNPPHHSPLNNEGNQGRANPAFDGTVDRKMNMTSDNATGLLMMQPPPAGNAAAEDVKESKPVESALPPYRISDGYATAGDVSKPSNYTIPSVDGYATAGDVSKPCNNTTKPPGSGPIYNDPWDNKSSSVKIPNSKANLAGFSPGPRPVSDGYATTSEMTAMVSKGQAPAYVPGRDSKGYETPDNPVNNPGHTHSPTRRDHTPAKPSTNPPTHSPSTFKPDNTTDNPYNLADDGYQSISETSKQSSVSFPSPVSTVSQPVSSPHSFKEGPYAETSLNDLDENKIVGPKGDVYTTVGPKKKSDVTATPQAEGCETTSANV